MNLFALSWLFRSLNPFARHVVIAVLAVAARALVIVPCGGSAYCRKTNR
jgi:hypothetical protein